MIVRGGGSADDLAVFNDELLVRAIAASRIPTLTGIGHETDESLSDLAADVAAVTPSNAAQILLPDRQAIIAGIKNSLERVADRYRQLVDESLETARGYRRQSVDSWLVCLQAVNDKLGSLRSLIQELNPEEVMRRGYAILSGPRQVGSILHILTKDEKITAKVESNERR